MTPLRRLVSIVRWLLRRKDAEQELDDELQAFIDAAACQKIRDGAHPAEAYRLAKLELRGIEQTKERVRSFRHGAWIDQVGRDFRYAFRSIVLQRGFSVVIVLTLALGIGANTAIFSLIDALMLRWLPVHDPQELIQLSMQPADMREPGESFSYAIVRALSDHDEIFAGVAGFSGYPADVESAGSVNRIQIAMVTGGYYTALGLNPFAGRLLNKQDDEPGALPAAVISYGYWERQFAQDPGVIGQTIRVNGLPVPIVGVSPPGFVGANVGSIADVTLAVAALPQIAPPAAALLGPGNFWLRILIRPRQDISIDQTKAQLAALWLQVGDQVIAAHWPPGRRKAMAESVFYFKSGGRGWTMLRAVYRKPLFVLMGMVGLVLLIACANVASLLLARASARRREMAVRLAMGAGRWRIVRQLLTESALVACAGALLGIGLSWVSGRFLVSMLSTGPFAASFDLTPNWRVLAFTAVIALATTMLFGLAPALQTTAVAPSFVLKEDARVSGGRSRLLPSLVVLQVALTLVLVIGASLFVRTLRNLQTLDIGFNRSGVLVAVLEGRRTAVPAEVLNEISGVRGVVSAGLSTHTPLSGAFWSEPAVPSSQTLPEGDTALFVGAGPGFLSTMQIALLAGRDLNERDTATGTPVALINEAYARRFFPGMNPVGQHLSARVRGKLQDLEIVGLVRNTNATDLRRPPRSTVYVAYSQLTGDFPTNLSIRVSGSLGEIASSIERLLRTKLPDSSVQVQPLSIQVEATMFQERMLATLAGGFGLLALVVACIGLYGLLTYRVARRTREIGIRMALGAERKRIVAMVLRGAGRLVLLGIGIGLPATWAAARWIESLLFGLKPTDPVTVTAAIILLVAVALLAAYLPAQRAAHVDPMIALRHE